MRAASEFFSEFAHGSWVLAELKPRDEGGTVYSCVRADVARFRITSGRRRLDRQDRGLIAHAGENLGSS
jgi:hypothetical protein